MILYTMIMFICAWIFGVVAIQIYKGKTKLIQDYHQKNVTDKEGYGKAFGKAMTVIAAAMVLSGTVALFGETVMWGAVAVLVVGIITGVIAILRVQKEYNGGLF